MIVMLSVLQENASKRNSEVRVLKPTEHILLPFSRDLKQFRCTPTVWTSADSLGPDGDPGQAKASGLPSGATCRFFGNALQTTQKKSHPIVQHILEYIKVHQNCFSRHSETVFFSAGMSQLPPQWSQKNNNA